MESITNDSIDLASLTRHMLAPSEESGADRPRPTLTPTLIAQYQPPQQGSLRSAQTALQHALSQPNHGDNHIRLGDPDSLMLEDDSGLPSTVPESLHAQAQFSQPPPLPQATTPDEKHAPESKKMSSQGAGGDDATQEVSQDFYDQQIQKSKSRITATEDRDETQHTLHQGDEGHIDFVSSFIEHEQQDAFGQESEPIDVDLLPTQDQTQSRVLRYPDSQRFKTPATAGKKRLHNGNTKESPLLPRAPVLRSGGGTPGMGMGLSQAFADTQAQTSPFMNGTQNPTSDRPSPNIDLDHRPATAPVSSPLKMLSEVRPSSAEPASHYVSVEESQRRRTEQMNRQLAEDEAGESDDSFDKPSTPVRRWQNQRRRSQDFREKSRGHTTSPRSSSRQRHQRSSALRSSPITVGQRAAIPSPGKRRATRSQHARLESVLIQEEEDPAESEAETEQEDEEAIVQRSSQRPPIDPEDKENLESAIQIPQTTARTTRAMPEINQDVQASPSLRAHQHPPSSAGPLVPNTQISQSGSQRVQPKSSTTSGLEFVPQSQDVDEQQHESSVNNPQIPDSPAAPKPVSSDEVPDVEGNVRRTSEQDEPEDEPAEDRDVSLLHDGDVEMRDDPQPEKARRSTAGNAHEGTIAPQLPSTFELKADEPHQNTDGETDLTRSVVRSKSHSGHTDHDASIESQSNFETAPSRMPPPNVKPPPSSSPLMSTPRSKRRQMSQISVEASPTQNGWSQDFNPRSALKLDSDLAVYDDQSPIGLGKRRKILYHTSIEVPETASIIAKAQVPPTSPDLGIDGTDELLDPQPAVRPQRERERLKRSTRAMKGASDRHSVWDVGITPSPQQKTPVVKVSGRPLRSATGKLPERANTPPIASKKDEAKLAQDDCSESSSEEHRPTQTETPKKTPTKKKRQARQISEESSPSAAGTPSETFRTASAGEILAPNVVFACFNGKTRAYYPAWCLGKGASEQHYTVQWEGYDPDEVDIFGVRSLDLRIGDQVKVDMKGVPKVSHVVRGFKDKVEGKELTQTMTDQRGFKTLLVAPKQRKSLPADVSTENGREVPISAIYLDTNMWTQMKDRTYEYRSPPESIRASGYATPVEQASTPTSPTSRHRRQTGVVPASTIPLQPGGVFKGMVFAISYEDGDRRRQLDSLIWGNGGRLVGDDGFYELFDPDSMALKPKYATSGFTALLADKHSRKPKYLQALALGLPCLSGKWIEACIEKQELVDWRRYLLPAGECDALDGATKSRIMAHVDAGGTKLVQQIESRDRILEHEKVIVIVGRGGKAEAKMKNYIFFIRAMGAETLERASDVRAAKELLDAADDDDGYTLIYVEKDGESVQAVLKAGAGSGGGSRKSRKRNNAAEWNVVETESIVQSLIFGASVD